MTTHRSQATCTHDEPHPIIWSWYFYFTFTLEMGTNSISRIHIIIWNGSQTSVWLNIFLYMLCFTMFKLWFIFIFYNKHVVVRFFYSYTLTFTSLKEGFAWGHWYYIPCVQGHHLCLVHAGQILWWNSETQTVSFFVYSLCFLSLSLPPSPPPPRSLSRSLFLSLTFPLFSGFRCLTQSLFLSLLIFLSNHQINCEK